MFNDCDYDNVDVDDAYVCDILFTPTSSLDWLEFPTSESVFYFGE